MLAFIYGMQGCLKSVQLVTESKAKEAVGRRKSSSVLS